MIFSINHITLFREQTQIVEDFSFTATNGSVIGVIGDNGSGKTSLLLALNGDIPYQAGSMQPAVMKMVEQDAMLMHGDDNIATWFADLEAWQVDYGIGIAGVTARRNKKIKDLSGGERTRLSIAYALKPWDRADVVLMDEPTNNLDHEGIEWLTEVVRRFEGIVFIVSHDRAFLNSVCNTMLFVENTKITEYAGNYDDFRSHWLHAREMQYIRYVEAKKTKESFKARIRQQEYQVRKGSSKHASDKDKQARSFFENRTGRRAGKALDSLKSKVDKIEQVEAPRKIVQYRTSILGHIQPKKLIVRVEDISFSYGNVLVLNQIGFELRGSGRVYVSGDNGVGKSTLLKIIAGKLGPDEGSVVYGKGVTIGYYAQDADMLDANKSLLQSLKISTQDEETALYENGKAIGLTPSDLNVAIGQLSRGQRSKAAILELLVNSYELLILDEPTNHLDVKAREVLEDALSRFEGALLFASHDKVFVQKLVNETTQQIRLRKY